MSAVPAPARPGDAIDAVDTPALLLDLDAFERNVAAVHGRIAERGLRLRAHGKAHKCSEIGRRQVAAGAVGLCCQKVGEAEAFVAGGIADVLVSNVIVGESKARRLAQLAQRARVAVCVDSALQVEQIGAAARTLQSQIGVLIEIDVGGRRCGVTAYGEALSLAEAIAAYRPWLELRGLQAYHGPAQHLREPQERRSAVEAAATCAAGFKVALEAHGFACAEICGGGTGSYTNEVASGVYTEIQAGSYVLMDADYAANTPDPDAPPLAQALSVLCTVITSRPEHAVLDGGLKAFALDSGLPRMIGPGWRVRGLSDEHTVILPGGRGRVLAVGDKIRLIPGHCDPTVNLHDWIVAHRNGRVEHVWPIDARGALF